ncbi:hypothetical protein ACJX0J_014658 [Zea mays]
MPQHYFSITLHFLTTFFLKQSHVTLLSNCLIIMFIPMVFGPLAGPSMKHIIAIACVPQHVGIDDIWTIYMNIWTDIFAWVFGRYIVYDCCMQDVGIKLIFFLES